MKTLIINGSPRVNGDTATMLREFKSVLDGEITELSAYRGNVSPCIDCRYCREHPECAIRDDMDLVYGDTFDAIVVASPVYYGTLTGPMMSLLSRLQIHHSAVFFRKEPIVLRPKLGAIILVGGGNKNYDGAERISRTALRLMGVTSVAEPIAMARLTDTLPAIDDEQAKSEARAVAAWLNAAKI